MIRNEIKVALLTMLTLLLPFVLCISVASLYTPSKITGTVKIIEDEDTDKPYYIVLNGIGDNILGNKDFTILKTFDETDEIICEAKNITDGDKVVFNHNGIIQYKIDE